MESQNPVQQLIYTLRPKKRKKKFYTCMLLERVKTVEKKRGQSENETKYGTKITKLASQVVGDKPISPSPFTNPIEPSKKKNH